MNQFADDHTCLASIKLLGDYWTLRIIDALQDGELRYCELQRRVDNLNPVTLTGRLKKLEDSKLINRVKDPKDKVSVCYSLTQIGQQSLPVIAAINTFATKSKTLT
jgi:DNA-binding HxlR family transcriptional regulator